ncbi:carbohydrate phosphatase [Lophiostoma macrostomum CBS 122681]|uniref:3'(2'),5'-bisphosphate nucleotidase n=1 Tax=Lophiostoma macrostomum CBS 122681 TaxID=1314788 RepID=A0A6A6TS66_9PLEO|nr:carbohydrate phosphatase [Lophiostoma macrostomum CBS 122681]
MSTPYASELRLALHAVHAASLLTKAVLRSLKNNVAAETKADDSPVTIADFAAQALIIAAVHAVYPDDRFIGEESAEALRQNHGLAERVWELVQRARTVEAARTSDLQHVLPHDGDAALAFPASKDEMLDVIDLGTSTGSRDGRVWVLDPVDGTATFMEGKQYAVCLSLLVDGVQQVGVSGCPNLQFETQGPLARRRITEDQVDADGYGVVLSAVKGQGTYVRSMHANGLGEARRIQHDDTPKQLSTLDFVESTIGKTSLSQDEHRAVAERVGAKWPGTVLWSQQMKYAALALGATDVLVRLPKDRDRFSYLWDHAGGHLLVQEAGGVIKDLDGGDIDYGQGRKILGDRNFGMVATMPSAFNGIMQAVTEVLEMRTR